MTLARGTDRLESDRLVLRRVTPDDLPFYTRLHARPEVAQHLYPGGRPRMPEETARWLPYAVSAILPQNARSRRAAERAGARAESQMEVVGLTWDRWVWPLAA